MIGDIVKEIYSDYTPTSALTLAILVIILAIYGYLSRTEKLSPIKEPETSLDCTVLKVPELSRQILTTG